MVSRVFSMFSEPYLLRRILGEQLGNNRSIDNKTYLLKMVFEEQLNDHRGIRNLLATAVHAILIDSGFVLLDPVSGLQNDRFRFPYESPSVSSFCYSLPQLFRFDHETGPRFTHHVVLKFQTLTHFLQVYGSLGKGGDFGSSLGKGGDSGSSLGKGGDSGLYRLSLDEHMFVPTLDLLWAQCLRNHTHTSSVNSYWKHQVLKFWKIVKDGLAFPLLIDLCYSSGLSLPGCLMSLPHELKLKVLDSLPGIDIARMMCVCSDMLRVASDNELWKRKVKEEFGDRAGGTSSWKIIFRSCWESRKSRKSRKRLKLKCVQRFAIL